MTAPADPITQFRAERDERIASYPGDAEFQRTSAEWVRLAFDRRYMYN